MSRWAQIYVKAPEGEAHTRQDMKRVDDTLTSSAPAAMKCPGRDGLPQQESDGTWEVRVFPPASDMAMNLVRGILESHHGLKIVREVIHDN